MRVRSAAENEDWRRAEAKGEGGQNVLSKKRSELRLGKPVNQKWDSHTFTSFKANWTGNISTLA